jgi:hypothetical protein
MPDVILNIESHSIRNEAALKFILKDLKDGKYLVSFKPYKRRSLNQNGYWWGCLVPLVKQGLNEAGWNDIRTNEDAHEYLKSIFVKKSIVNFNTGEVATFTGSTTELNTVEFAKLVDDVIQWAVEFLNVQIPYPGESLIMFNE